MADLSILTRYCLGILLVGFIATVIWKLITREINLEHLLAGDDDNGVSSFSPGRAQLLILTILTASNFMIESAKNPGAGMPTPPEWLIATLGGSQAIYLVGKYWSTKGRRS